MAAIEASLISGAAIGLSIAAPFGPSSMLCIQRTLAGGFFAGMASGLGLATVHLTYGSMASLSGLEIAALSHGSFLFPLFSGLLLLWFAYRMVRKVVVFSDSAETRKSFVLTYFSAVLFGFFNPLTPLLFVALSPSLLGADQGAANWVVTGLFLGSILWWLSLAGCVSYFRGSVTPRLLNASNKVAGMVFLVMAVMMIVRSYPVLG